MTCATSLLLLVAAVTSVKQVLADACICRNSTAVYGQAVSSWAWQTMQIDATRINATTYPLHNATAMWDMVGMRKAVAAGQPNQALHSYLLMSCMLVTRAHSVHAHQLLLLIVSCSPKKVLYYSDTAVYSLMMEASISVHAQVYHDSSVRSVPYQHSNLRSSCLWPSGCIWLTMLAMFLLYNIMLQVLVSTASWDLGPMGTYWDLLSTRGTLHCILL